jgi:hypothetical protein
MNPTASEQPLPAVSPPAVPPEPVILRDELGRTYEFPPECIPNVDDLVLEDRKAVENIFVERQYRLLTEPLYSSWRPSPAGRSFLAVANVGLFFQMKEPALVPDAMLSLDVKAGDPSRRENLSYLLWVMGKPPDVVIEIVSDRRGGEETHKLRSYARLGIPYYVIFDYQDLLGGGVLRAFGLREGNYQPVAANWLPAVGLGLMLWPGTYQDLQGTWLRWGDESGQPIPTGQERAEQERQRAEQEHQRAERFLQQLRDAGIEPSA